jgi:hypothetical protein
MSRPASTAFRGILRATQHTFGQDTATVLGEVIESFLRITLVLKLSFITAARDKVRQEFRANMNETNPAKVAKVFSACISMIQ